jgi:hypothetical protein
MSEPWHLDKKVPVALIFAIAMQTAGAIWWASAVNSRIAALEHGQLQVSSVNDRLARMEERVIGLSEGIRDIKTAVRDLAKETNGRQ